MRRARKYLQRQNQKQIRTQAPNGAVGNNPRTITTMGKKIKIVHVKPLKGQNYLGGTDPVNVPSYVQSMINEDEWMAQNIRKNSENEYILSAEELKKKIEDIFEKNKKGFPVYKNGNAIIDDGKMLLVMEENAFNKMMDKAMKEYIEKNKNDHGS